ncbi:hypothetical protein M8C21_015406 [Ambrosia artemisiifolia]|uniref:Fe2OG dioxygenase domain-containing protein n=1 Tax=Ambrosia artemisiifolia TaxID=4212 RepID=A0AAD5C6F6_AMBAR|nr:hypothetical protein M8C21_015406 [Ambrosia artemisiifolia]
MNSQVQEIAAHCDQLPERYIQKEDEEHGNVTNNNASSPAKIPVIDLSLLTSSHLELDKLKTASTSWGCFQAINHGIEGSFLDKVREVSRLFFDLSAEEKKCLSEENDVEGYGNDMVFSDDQILDWTDRLYLTAFPKDQQRLKFWPKNPTNFKEVVDDYISKIELINHVILKAVARSLNLEENCFLDQYGTASSKMVARFNYYPPCPWPDKVVGLKPHTDGSAFTFVLQDKEVEGLQVLKDGKWFGVPIVPDALMINVGEQIEIMSNGIFKSPVHRAMVNTKNQRISLAVFCMPQTIKDIGPVDGLITDVTPRLYKNVTFSTDFFFQNNQQGKRRLDVCKI